MMRLSCLDKSRRLIISSSLVRFSKFKARELCGILHVLNVKKRSILLKLDSMVAPMMSMVSKLQLLMKKKVLNGTVRNAINILMIAITLGTSA